MATSNPTGVEAIFFDAAIRPGNSGSPVVNGEGKVLGLACFTYLESSSPTVTMEDMAGGTNQYLAQRIVDSIINSNSDYTQKGYLGLGRWAPCIGRNLSSLRNAYPSFRPNTISQARGIIIQSLDTSGAGSGRRVHRASPTPLQVDDVILSAQLSGQPSTLIKLGVYDQEYHISRLTWFSPPGTVLIIEVIRPATRSIFRTNVVLDSYPKSQDRLFTNAVAKPIDSLPELAQQISFFD